MLSWSRFLIILFSSFIMFFGIALTLLYTSKPTVSSIPFRVFFRQLIGHCQISLLLLRNCHKCFFLIVFMLLFCDMTSSIDCVFILVISSCCPMNSFSWPSSSLWGSCLSCISDHTLRIILVAISGIVWKRVFDPSYQLQLSGVAPKDRTKRARG